MMLPRPGKKETKNFTPCISSAPVEGEAQQLCETHIREDSDNIAQVSPYPLPSNVMYVEIIYRPPGSLLS